MHAVQSVDLQVRAGELVAVLGPNGAGKTTALGMLAGLSAPTSGTARLFGRDPRGLGARQRMGVMLQSSGVPDTLRVHELLTAFRGYYPAPLPFAAVVDAAGLHGLEDKLFGTLSGGQQRRVLFGIAPCGDPELVFVDEPTTGLDAEVRRTLWQTLRTLTESGRGIVLTTHYLEEADTLADRIIVLHHGRVIAEGTPAQIKSLVPGRRISVDSSLSVEDTTFWPGVRRARAVEPGSLSQRADSHRAHAGRRVSHPDRPDGGSSLSATITTDAAQPTRAEPPRPHRHSVLRVYRTEAWQEFLKLMRLRIFAASTIALPLMFYVIFGLTFAGEQAGGVGVTTYMLVTYGAFGVIGAALFGFGVSVAVERGQGWMRLKRVAPMPPLACFVAKVLMSLAVATIIVLAMFVLVVGLAAGYLAAAGRTTQATSPGAPLQSRW